jgi:hypothetical protein
MRSGRRGSLAWISQWQSHLLSSRFPKSDYQHHTATNACVCPANKVWARNEEAGCWRNSTHGAGEAGATRSSSTGGPRMHVVVGDLLLLHIPTSLMDNTLSRGACVFPGPQLSQHHGELDGQSHLQMDSAVQLHRELPRPQRPLANQADVGGACPRLVFADGYFSPSLAPMLERRRLALGPFFSGPTLAGEKLLATFLGRVNFYSGPVSQPKPCCSQLNPLL